MGEGAWLVAFLVAQRLVELGFAQSNTEGALLNSVLHTIH